MACVIDEYVARYTGRHRELMTEIAALIRELAPQAGEKISWQMPTFTLNGNLVHFAAGKNHVGFYPGVDGVKLVTAELDELGLKHSKGAIQLKLDQPLPRELLTRIITFRVEQQEAKRAPK